VLQAGAIGKPGQICVLDMGRPIKIVDLARRMIVDAGLMPGDDIPIVFTGKRPGEKLFEELASLLEDTAGTEYEHIRALVPWQADRVQLARQIEMLRVSCETRDIPSLVETLRSIVSEYSPSTELLQMIRDARGSRAVGSPNN
jgi:FlaA1/EpsC-like NDP-sugar epimerase